MMVQDLGRFWVAMQMAVSHTGVEGRIRVGSERESEIENHGPQWGEES